MKPALVLLAFAAVILPALGSDQYLPPGVDASLPAFPAQLRPGSKPGTFRYSMPVLVKFSQQPEFPVDVVLEDYAHRVAFTYRLRGPGVSILTCDLKPGTYSTIYKMIGTARENYQDLADDDSGTFLISPSGRSGWYFAGFHSEDIPAHQGRVPYSTFIRRKIELISPKPKALISDNKINFKWKPVSGIKEYLIYICPIADVDHPASSFPAEHAEFSVKGDSKTLSFGLEPDNLYVHPGESYIWSVDDNDHVEQDGRIARSSLQVFTVAGKMERIPGDPPKNFMRDEAIEPRLAVRLQQPYIPSDGGDGISSVNVLALGNGPLLKANLGIGSRIVSLDGKGTPDLTAFHECLAAILSGKTVQVGVIGYDEKLKKMVMSYSSIVVP